MDYIGVVPDVEVNNDDDPKVDEQLEAGEAEIQKQIDALAAAQKRRDEIKVKNDEVRASTSRSATQPVITEALCIKPFVWLARQNAIMRSCLHLRGRRLSR